MKPDEKIRRARTTLRDDQPAGQELFQELLEQYPESQEDIFRERSLGYAEIGKFEMAFADRRAIAESAASHPNDCYFAGEYAMQAGVLQEAASYFERCIGLSIKQMNEYYLNSARLLAALCHCRLGDRMAALKFIQDVPSDTSVMWLEGFPDNINKEVVLNELRREQK